MLERRAFLWALAVGAVAGPLGVEAQTRVHRVGVIHPGSPFERVIEGLRVGLREVGLEEGKHILLHVRDTRGDLEAVEEAARDLVREKVNLIYTVPASVTRSVKRVTADIPVVFVVGTDPVKAEFVESFAKPGDRLTGIHNRSVDLTAKRLEFLKEILPKARRVVTFYNPNNPSARAAAASGRAAARQLRVEFLERHVASVEELRARLKALRVGEADAFLFVPDVIISNQSHLIVDAARAIRLPTMFHDRGIVAKGALASYGHDFHEVGRLSAKYVQRILAGANPRDLPVENIDRLDFVLNLRTARELGLTIPPSVVPRVDHVIK